MPTRLTLFLPTPNPAEGNRWEPPQDDPQIQSRRLSISSLRELSPEACNSLLRDCGTELVGFAEGTSQPLHEFLRELISAGKFTSTSMIPTSIDHPAQLVWKCFPARLACLLFPPTQEATFVLPQTLAAEFEWHAPESPLWELMIHLCERGKSVIQHIPTPPLANAGSVQAFSSALVPRSPSRKWIAEHLRAFHPSELIPGTLPRVELTALEAGLYQWHNFLDESHQHSQSIEGEGKHHNGDYWHAIMHRREPDYSNAKYWFRRVGTHPIFPRLAKRASDLMEQAPSEVDQAWKNRLVSGDSWDPFAFVDFCQEAVRKPTQALTDLAEEIQISEMLLLLEQTWKDAGGTMNGAGVWE